ncbi:PAS domain S-box protein [Mucilaginibacter celer]|uniref:histidine kinase n=1 Tax=Mucilaginibacter celer TaxID=2305508 RepID=A0A494VW22_9SPHI|nr:PAS domain S-box protein [Mucilaginibacter celer]AYL95182.1 PAS domain S-box protein [Mucilaginibacter celer]
MNLQDNELLHTIVQSAPIGICILDAFTFKAEMLNDKFLEIAGKPKEAIIGKWYWDPFAEARTYYEAAMVGVVQTGEAYYAEEAELMLIRHGREEIIVVTFVYAPVKDETGKVTKLAIWVLENTRQVKERKAISASEQRLRALVTATSDVTYSVSADWQIMNELDGRGFLKDTDKPITGWRERNVHPDDLDKVNAAIEEAIKAKKIFQLEHRVLRTDGSPGWTFSRAVPILDNESNIVEWFGTASDITQRKQVEEALQEVRQQADQQKRVYEAITSGTPDLMYVWDLDYRFTYVNSALLSMWGKTWDTAIGKGLRENGYEEWHAQMHEREIDQVRATKQSVRGEVSFPHATLGRRIYDYILIPVLNETGEVEAVAGTTRDVTERKQMEQALAQSSEELQAINEEMAATNEEQAASNEELTATNQELASVNQQLQKARRQVEKSETALRLAIEAANFGTWFINSETREFITDTRLKELFGYYPDEPLSIEQAIAQITEEYRGFVSDKLENAIYNHGDYDVTYPVKGLHDQQLRWLRAIGNLQADPSGAFSAFTGVVMDITQQHLAAQKMEDSEKHFRYLADLVPAKISNALPSGEVTFFNKQWLDYAGMNFEDLRDFGYHAMMHPDEIPEFAEKLREAATKGMALESEMRFKDINGNYRWHLNIASPVLNEEGEITMWVGSTTDIQRMKEEEQRKSDFIGMVSHELKTPLTSLNAYLQVMQAKLGKADDQFIERSLEQSAKQVKKMTAMINGFLNVSRLESGQIAISKAPFDIQELFAEAREEVNPMHTAHTITFACKSSVSIFGDHDKIGQVLNNLISNAVKYSRPGTEIVVNCRLENKQVVISVSDVGIGIKPDDVKHVFDRYYRADSLGHVSGFGIGLYLCAEIIRRHDGKIWVESQIEKGSTFYFSLPLN